MDNIMNVRKSKENFVQWKKANMSEGPRSSRCPPTLKSYGTRNKEVLSTSSNSRLAPRASAMLSGRVAIGMKSIACGTRSPMEQRHPPTSSPKNARSDVVTSRSRLTVSTVAGNANNRMLGPSFSRPQSSNGQRIVSTKRQPPLESLHPSMVPSSSTENIAQNKDVGSPISQSLHQVVVERFSEARSDKIGSIQSRQRRLSSTGGPSDGMCEGYRRQMTTPTLVEEEQDFTEPDKDFREDRRESSNWWGRPQQHSPTFYSNNPNDNGTGDSGSEGQGTYEMEEANIEYPHDMHDLQGMTYENETTKRRERRQAQSSREREGQRRRKEGLPRNYLLVDEFTRKPYGVGVGDWRKELMLLSRNLDPAIGNINRQPEGAVVEIGEWIQQTWEYSFPVKFEFVKEVIARGVTLRRIELWKMIRNNEDKPEKVSDRTWKILKRQLENPASIRKSESCRKANASRVNFGRTGPSGEVGVRERLRKKLRRSPEPEEIRFEMARDKGYGGRKKKQKSNQKENLMHESAGGLDLLLPVLQDRDPSRISNDEGSAQVGEDDHADNMGDEYHVAMEVSKASGQRDGVRDVLSMSAEEIAQHPLVKSMMQRLEALEGQQSVPVVPVNGNSAVANELRIRQAEDKARAVVEATVNDLQDGSGAMQLEETEAPRRSQRAKKKFRPI